MVTRRISVPEGVVMVPRETQGLGPRSPLLMPQICQDSLDKVAEEEVN